MNDNRSQSAYPACLSEGKPVKGNLPKISIVTPSYNQGKYLEKTIRSVIEQGYPNLEYIIIDGGSTDESVEIIKRYEKHLAYWVSEPDRGQSHAVNKGFERATGEIFGWLNSDDWYHPGALKAVAETFVANPEAGAVVGGGDFVDEAGNVIVRTVPEKVTLDNLYSWFDSYFWQPSCFFTRHVWEAAGRLDESLHLSMDYDLWLRIAKKFTFVTTGEILSASLKHAEAKTTARLHESDHMTLKLVMKHGGERAFDLISASYERRLVQSDEGHSQELAAKDRTIDHLHEEIIGKQQEISRLNGQMAQTVDNLKQQILEKEQILNSLSWRITRPLRYTVDKVINVAAEINSISKIPMKLSATDMNLLFVDYQVPHYDRFAGSRTNFMYLKLIKRMGLRVILLPADFKKVEPYTSELHNYGIETLDGAWTSKNWQRWLRLNGHNIDFVFFNKPEPTLQFIEKIKKQTKACILYQVHDLHYLRLKRKYELDGNESVLEEACRYEQMERIICEQSDVLLTFSDVEHKILEANFPEKLVATLPLYFFETFKASIDDFSQRKDILFVGGFGHAPNVDAVEWFSKEVLPEIFQSEQSVRFLVVGENPPERIIALRSERIVLLGSVSEDELERLYSTVRLVVIPLRFGAGVKGKTIEAMYRGVPLVSTSIGLEGILGITDLFAPADSPEDFAHAVVSLYQDESLLEEYARKGQEFVKNNFSISTAEASIRRVLGIGTSNKRASRE